MMTREKFITVYQDKARANLGEATSCLQNGLPRATISRAYYAAYQAANAWIAHKMPDSSFNPDWSNAHHEEVEKRWRTILAEIHDEHGVDPDYDGDTLYGVLKSLRVRVDYKPRFDPTVKDAEIALASADRAVRWLTEALRKAGR